MTRACVLPHLDPATYARHDLHSEHRVWIEKNCYIDVWIEMLHALGLDPMAMLSSTVAVDHEGDQWTFFKPPHTELFELYNIDVQELSVWRPLIDQVQEYLAQNAMISTEVDAFWLPDVVGTDYRSAHAKTTILIQDMDIEARSLGYFHNASYHRLVGDDFDSLFHRGTEGETRLPLFAELVRVDAPARRSRQELACLSLAMLRRHFSRRPILNPIERFEARLREDMAWIQREGLEFYHQWAFANVRQMGAAFELQALYLRWLDCRPGGCRFGRAAEAFQQIGSCAKALILKAARAAGDGRELQASNLFCRMGDAWQLGMTELAQQLDR